MLIAMEQMHWLPDQEMAKSAYDLYREAGIPAILGYSDNGTYWVSGYYELREGDLQDLKKLQEIELPHGVRWCILPQHVQGSICL